jgi:hypothetical protein
MYLFSWLHKRMTGRPQTQRTPQRKPTLRFRPQLETLEARDVPSTLTVTSAADSGPGSLRAEIAAANPGDTINFAPSLNGQTITLTSGELVLNKSLTIQGPGASQLAIGGQGTRHEWYEASRVFEVSGADTNVMLSGLTLTRAVSGYGGAIYNHDGSNLTISGCTLSYNRAGDGGAIYNLDATLHIVNCTLTGNTAGGSLVIPPWSPGGTDYGGAVFTHGGSVSMNGCSLSNNYGINEGGAVWMDSTTTMTISDCSFSNNTESYSDNFHGNDINNFNYNPAHTGLTVKDSIFYNSNPGYPIEGVWTNGGGNYFGY